MNHDWYCDFEEALERAKAYFTTEAKELSTSMDQFQEAFLNMRIATDPGQKWNKWVLLDSPSNWYFASC